VLNIELFECLLLPLLLVEIDDVLNASSRILYVTRVAIDTVGHACVSFHRQYKMFMELQSVLISVVCCLAK